ncbi:hypothetical protein D3C76_1312260 [compost metagenome]
MPPSVNDGDSGGKSLPSVATGSACVIGAAAGRVRLVSWRREACSCCRKSSGGRSVSLAFALSALCWVLEVASSATAKDLASGASAVSTSSLTGVATAPLSTSCARAMASAKAALLSPCSGSAPSWVRPGRVMPLSAGVA